MHHRTVVLAILITAAAAAPAGGGRQAPVRWGPVVLRQAPSWYGSAAARALADAVVRHQSPQGGWPKNTDLAVPPGARPDVGLANTIDNGATVTPLRLLALVITASGDQQHRESFERGLRYVLGAQSPSGGWPQFFPLRPGYYSHITYNDVALGQPPYAFVAPPLRARAWPAIERGTSVILRTQIRQGSRLTGWCAQHDETTLAPAWARNYEPPSLSGHESVGIVRFLMSIERPSTEVVAAVDGAVAWLEAVALHGLRVEEFTDSQGRADRRAVSDPAAGRLWARFYELETNRPIFIGRDRVIRYDHAEIEQERRSGYAYYGTWPERLLTTEYPNWREERVERRVAGLHRAPGCRSGVS